MLECTNEMQLASEGSPDDSTALDAFVDDLEDEMDGEQAPEPVTAETASFDKMEKEDSDKDEMRKSDSSLNSRNANSSKHGEPLRSNSICNNISLEDLHHGRACMMMFRSQTWEEVVRVVHRSLSLLGVTYILQVAPSLFGPYVQYTVLRVFAFDLLTGLSDPV